MIENLIKKFRKTFSEFSQAFIRWSYECPWPSSWRSMRCSPKTLECLYPKLLRARRIRIGGRKNEMVTTPAILATRLWNYSQRNSWSLGLATNQDFFAIQGALIRTGQKYEWLVHFFVFVWLDQSEPSKIFWPVHFCKKMFSGPSSGFELAVNPYQACIDIQFGQNWGPTLQYPLSTVLHHKPNLRPFEQEIGQQVAQVNIAHHI